MSEPRNPADRYHHGDLARAATDEAFAMVAALGAAEVSLRAVAARLRVTHRALYRHFADRESLLAACAAMGFARLADAVQHAGAPQPFCRAYVQFALAQPNIYALMMSRFTATPPALAANIERVIRAALVAFDNEPAAKRAWLTLHGGLALHAAGVLAQRDQHALEAFLIEIALGGALSP